MLPVAFDDKNYPKGYDLKSLRAYEAVQPHRRAEWEMAKELVKNYPNKYKFRVDRNEYGTTVYVLNKKAIYTMNSVARFFWNKEI